MTESATELTVEAALQALAKARRFRASDVGFAHAAAARASIGVTLDATVRARAHRLLESYSAELRMLGLDPDLLVAPPTDGRQAAAQAAVAAASSAPIGRSTVSYDGTSLWLKAPFAMRERVKHELPGSAWKPAKAAWQLPGTPMAALAVFDMLGQHGIDGDPGSAELLRRAHAGRSAQAKRTALDLPPVPGSKTDAWGHQRQAFWFARELEAAQLDMEMGEQPYDALVLTPTGWSEFGALQEGDYVIGGDGQPVRVEECRPWVERETWTVVTTDGARIPCSPNHLWTVAANKGGWQTLPLHVIAEQLADPATPRGARLRRLPSLSAPTWGEHADLPLDPYVLGVLLAEGATGGDRLRFRADRPGIVAEVARRGCAVTSDRESRYHWITGRKPKKLLADLGLSGLTAHDKFVPLPYRRASAEQRLDLLRGLMDGDGCAVPAPYYSTVSFRLAEDVSELVRSLGGAGGLYFAGENEWRVTLSLPPGLDPFLASGRVWQGKRRRHRLIASIEQGGPRVPMRCIRVANPDGLYVTNGYVLTHNTGKSKIVCDLVHDSGAETTFITCPERVVGVWPKQFGLHCGGEKHVVDPRRQKRDGGWELIPIAKRLEAYEHALHVCDCGLPHVLMGNFAAAGQDTFRDWMLRQRFDYLVYDESHRLRSHGGVWSKFAGKMQKRGARRLGGTGTLQAQTPMDVFGQFRALDPGVFGNSFVTFQKRYAVMGGFEGREFRGMQPDREAEFAAKIASITYRAGEEVLDLPAMLPDVTVTGRLEPRAMKAYKALEEDLFATVQRELDGVMVDDEVSVDNVLVKILRCQQITGGALPLDSGEVEPISEAKLALLIDELEDLPEREPVVVFAKFHYDLDQIERAAAKLKRPYAELSGRRDDALAHDATLADGVVVVGVQQQAGGTGVDFTRAAYGIYYSASHSLSDYLQSRKRLQRPGQLRSVRFRHLVMEGTIDEDVYLALAARESVTKRIGERVRRLQAAS